MIDPHCRIGRVRLKGKRNISTRLPSKTIEVALKLRTAIQRGATRG